MNIEDTTLAAYDDVNLENDYLSNDFELYNSSNIYPQKYIPHTPDTSPPGSPKELKNSGIIKFTSTI